MGVLHFYRSFCRPNVTITSHARPQMLPPAVQSRTTSSMTARRSFWSESSMLQSICRKSTDANATEVNVQNDVAPGRPNGGTSAESRRLALACTDQSQIYTERLAAFM